MSTTLRPHQTPGLASTTGAPVGTADFAPYFAAPQEMLQLACDTRRSVRARILALGEMAALVDEIFAAHCHEFLRAAENSDSMVLMPTAVTTRYVTPLLDQAAGELMNTLAPRLAAERIEFVTMAQLAPTDEAAMEAVFRRELYPLLIPLAVDPGHPFPRLRHGELNLLIQLRTFAGDSIMGGTLFAVLNIPARLPRWIRVPALAPGGIARYVWIEDLLTHFVSSFFHGIDVIHVYLFRVLRCNTDIARGRLYGSIVRLDIGAPVPSGVSTWLANHLRLPAHTVVRNQTPLAMADLRLMTALLPAPPRWYRRTATRIWHFFFGHI